MPELVYWARLESGATLWSREFESSPLPPLTFIPINRGFAKSGLRHHVLSVDILGSNPRPLAIFPVSWVCSSIGRAASSKLAGSGFESLHSRQFHDLVAEWLGRGLQSRLHAFDPRRDLQYNLLFRNSSVGRVMHC